MEAAAELESRFGRFDAERKSAREQLQTSFVRWGGGMAVLGFLASSVGVVVADSHAINQVPAWRAC
jgi:hypothetical protein